MNCLLDTGARISVLDKSIIDKIRNIKLDVSDDKIFCANDSSLKIYGKVTLLVQLIVKRKILNFMLLNYHLK